MENKNVLTSLTTHGPRDNETVNCAKHGTNLIKIIPKIIFELFFIVTWVQSRENPILLRTNIRGADQITSRE